MKTNKKQVFRVCKTCEYFYMAEKIQPNGKHFCPLYYIWVSEKDTCYAGNYSID